MLANKDLNLLILCVVLCQGIIGTLSEKDIDESPELLVRQKRVINRLPGGDVKQSIRNVPYIVSIKPYRVRHYCIGVILTNNIVLTISKCVAMENQGYYRVHSGTARTSTGGNYMSHNVIVQKRFVGYHPQRPTDGIALISVSPPFVFSLNTQSIPIYDGPIQPGRFATVSGWGHNAEGHPGTAYPEHLRSIIVPIISNQECAVLYGTHSLITESDICTFDATEHQYCGAVGDAGAPLVTYVNEKPHLIGIHHWYERDAGKCKPDVFVNLRNPGYHSWILENVRIVEAELSLQHRP